MLEDIKQLKKLRKNLQITQKELSQQAGVSQSFIAKVESGRLDPTYSKYKQIFNTIRSLTKKNEKKAADIMEKNIKSIGPENTIQQAIKKMKNYNISQIPVFREGQVIGIISDSIMLDALGEGKTKQNKVKEIMRDAPPTITKNADISLVTQILKHYPLVVVFEKEKAKGVISKADLFNVLSN